MLVSKKLLLVDYENKQKIDLSPLDESYRAIIFVGANQNPPKASKKPTTAHRFSRVDFFKISGDGKNALDFHIAFLLGRTFETAPDTECFVLSGDRGFDPLLNHLSSNGMSCRRVESIFELVSPTAVPSVVSDVALCQRCKRASTIEHHGGQWCTNCGRYVTEPDYKLLPSNQASYREPEKHKNSAIYSVCGWCHRNADMSDGIYDDGEWMCGGCIGGFQSKF